MMTDCDIMYWWGWDQNKYRWRVPLTSACSLAGACCPGFQMIHLVKDKLDDGNYKSCQALAPCSRSGRPPRGRFLCWTTPPWGYVSNIEFIEVKMKASKNLEVWRALNIRQDQWILEENQMWTRSDEINTNWRVHLQCSWFFHCREIEEHFCSSKLSIL